MIDFTLLFEHALPRSQESAITSQLKLPLSHFHALSCRGICAHPKETRGMCALWMWPISQRARNIIITVLYTPHSKRRRSAVIVVVDAFREVLEIILRFFLLFCSFWNAKIRARTRKPREAIRSCFTCLLFNLIIFFPLHLFIDHAKKMKIRDKEFASETQVDNDDELFFRRF